MTTMAALETDGGKEYKLIQEDGIHSGNALAVFLTHLAAFCNDVDSESEIFEWYRTLVKSLNLSICQLSESFYQGDWDYDENEYERYSSEASELQLTENQFARIVAQVRDKWRDATSLLKIVTEILSSSSIQDAGNCSGRKRTSVLENVLGYTVSATITVLNSHSMKADCDFVDSTTKSNTEE